MEKFAPGHVPRKPEAIAWNRAYEPYHGWDGDPNYDAQMLKTL